MNKNNETLTKEEQETLKESGYSSYDIREILQACKKATYSIINAIGEKKDITEKKAIRLLGRDEWIRAMSRVAFHMESTRTGLNGERIYVFSKMWSR